MEIFPINADLSVPKKVKFGIDPTHSRLHLGHFVPLRLVRKMQEQGYHITIVLGTFTAQLGDPTGRESTRPIISADNAEINAGKILGQINNFLLPGFDVFKNATIHNNTLLPQFMAVAAEFTTSQMLARNNFKLRQETNQPIGLHELLVPLLQGLDSVFLDTEIEIGGEDQLFNFQVARKLQENRGLKQQACIMLPIINGVDGKKMSKSADNCIFLDEIPEEIFGKVMRISDELMMEWLPLLSDTIEIPTHPMEIKKTLAFDIVKQIHSLQIAKNCLNNFIQTIQKKEVPEEISLIEAKTLLEAICEIRNCSKSEAGRLLKSNSVSINNTKVSDNIELKPGQIIKVGKLHFGRIS